MAYQNVRFIAYCINTAPLMDSNGNKKYIGLPNYKDDIKARVALVEQAIKLAEEKLGPQDDDNTLKIFMMPEFFFRGKDGAYQLKYVLGDKSDEEEVADDTSVADVTVDTVVADVADDTDVAADTEEVRYSESLISQLQFLVKDPQWKHWLFVFGTIVAAFEIDDSDIKEVYNYAFVQKGGFINIKDASNHSKVIQKEYKAHDDFISKNELFTSENDLDDSSRSDKSVITHDRALPPLKSNLEQLRMHLSNLVGAEKNNDMIEEHFKSIKEEIKDAANNEIDTLKEKRYDIIELLKTKEDKSYYDKDPKKKYDIYQIRDWKEANKNKEKYKKDETWKEEVYSILEKYLKSKDQDKLLLRNLDSEGINLPKLDKLIPFLYAFIGTDESDTKELIKIQEKNDTEKNDTEKREWVSQRNFIKQIIDNFDRENYVQLEEKLYEFKKPEYKTIKKLIRRYLKLHKQEGLLAGLSYERTSFFVMDGITFGLEVCADHYQRRLKKLKNQIPTIDIQLIPSCGAYIHDLSVVVPPDGYVFNCDGLDGFENMENHIIGKKMVKEDGTELYDSHSSLARKNETSFRTPLIPSLTYIPLNDESKYDINSPANIDQIYAHGAGQLHIYPTKPLPGSQSSSLSLASSFNEPVLLNGMKVLFDKAAPVYPVNLTPKDKIPPKV